MRAERLGEDAGAVAEHYLELLEGVVARVAAGDLDRRDPSWLSAGAPVRLQEVVDAGELAEQVGPELNVLPISPSVDESGARAVEEGPPAALGERVPLVDVGGGEEALDGEGDAELVGELGGEITGVVSQPLIHHAGVARVGEEVSVVAEKGADGADDLGGAAVLEEVDGVTAITPEK